MPELQDGDQLIVGYVGHWSGSQETIRYIRNVIIPVAQSLKIDVTYDNTACYPLEDPELIQEFLNDTRFANGSSIEVKGSQTLSTGIWDIFTVGINSYYAYASTSWQAPRFWSCDKVESAECNPQIQTGEHGRCYDLTSKSLIDLTCRKSDKGNRRKTYWLR